MKSAFVFFALLLSAAYLANLSSAKPAYLSNENVEDGVGMELNIQDLQNDERPITEICPPWVSRLPGGCRRYLRLKRSIRPCPPWRAICTNIGK